MKHVMLKLSVLLLSSALPAMASASYKNVIAQQTAQFKRVSGTWYTIREDDWLFYRAEAAAKYNLGRVKAGERLEVLKMNNYMARVRTPDGRVLYVRNRLLTRVVAPTKADIAERAQETALIGKNKLHGGTPYTYNRPSPRVYRADGSYTTIAQLQAQRQAKSGTARPPARPAYLDKPKADSTIAPAPVEKPAAKTTAPPSRPAVTTTAPAPVLAPSKPETAPVNDPRNEPKPQKKEDAPAAKPEPKKEEPKVEPKVEPKTEPKAEPKTPPKAEPKAEPKTEPKAAPKSDKKDAPVAPANPNLPDLDLPGPGIVPSEGHKLTAEASALIKANAEPTEKTEKTDKKAQVASAKADQPEKAPKGDKQTTPATKKSENKPLDISPAANAEASTKLVSLYNGAKCDPKAEWQSPVRETYRVTDCLGSPRDEHDRMHAGVDIAGATPGKKGTPIFAASPGKVILARPNGAYGCLVVIQHDNCPAETTGMYAKSGKCTTRYAHMATKVIKTRKGSYRVCDIPEEGTMVNSCTPIGKMSGTGSSGSSDDYASHLHFEMRDHSESVAFNPVATLTKLTANPNLNKAGSASCLNAKNKSIVAVSAPALNDGRLEVRISNKSGGRE